MPTFLVETYLARSLSGERAERDRRAGLAATELSRLSADVVFERSIHVPADEICFYVFRAPSASDAALAADRAGLDPIRIVETDSTDKEEP